MPLNIKSERAHALARQLSEQTGESLTTVVVHALEKEVERMALVKKPDNRVAELNRIALSVANLPILDARSADEIIGYDENGLPS